MCASWLGARGDCTQGYKLSLPPEIWHVKDSLSVRGRYLRNPGVVDR